MYEATPPSQDVGGLAQCYSGAKRVKCSSREMRFDHDLKVVLARPKKMLQSRCDIPQLLVCYIGRRFKPP
jgi:hypothetical protein